MRVYHYVAYTSPAGTAPHPLDACACSRSGTDDTPVHQEVRRYPSPYPFSADQVPVVDGSSTHPSLHHGHSGCVPRLRSGNRLRGQGTCAAGWGQVLRVHSCSAAARSGTAVHLRCMQKVHPSRSLGVLHATAVGMRRYMRVYHYVAYTSPAGTAPHPLDACACSRYRDAGRRGTACAEGKRRAI